MIEAVLVLGIIGLIAGSGLAFASKYFYVVKDERIEMNEFTLTGWGKNVTYHERLKESYYMIKEVWAEEP